MLYQEVALWDAKRTKEKSLYTAGPAGIRKMIDLIDKQVGAELKRVPEKHTSRAKRELALAKQNGLIDDFRMEQAGLGMLYQDGDSTKRRFHEIRTFQLGMTTHLIVPQEMAGSTLLNKVEQRLTGYTRSLVQALHERREASTKVGNERGKRLWGISTAISRVVSGLSCNEPVTWPQSAHLTEILATLELIEHQSASLRSAVGSHNSSSVQSGPSTNSPNRTNIAPGGSIAESIGTEYNERFTNGLDRISESYQVLTKMLLLLRDWPDEDEMDVVIIQWFRAFRATLCSDYMAYVDVHALPEEALEHEVRTARGNEVKAVTCIDVATELSWWIRAMINGKRNELNPKDVVVDSADNKDGAMSQWHKKQERQKNMTWNNKKKKEEEEPLPDMREPGDGFYLAVFATYPDAFFAARSVCMQLQGAISTRKLVLEHRNRLIEEMDQVVSTATSRAEIEEERRRRGEAEAERLADIDFIKMAHKALFKLTHVALDLCQLVLTPLEDVFCTVRKLGIGDFRYIETGERCVTEALRLVCTVMVACSSERPHGLIVPAPTTATNPPQATSRGKKESTTPKPTHIRITDENVIENAQIFSTAENSPLLQRCHKLYLSCSKICCECADNIPMQSALMQTVNVIALYVLQEDARLIHRRKLAAAELATLKPIEQVLTDIFGAGSVADAPSDPSDESKPETEQQRWDRLVAGSKQPHREIVGRIIESTTEIIPALLTSMERHKEIPSLQYYGFLNLRLLFRLPFLKPNQLEELLSEGDGDRDDPSIDGLEGGVGGLSQSISGGPSILDVNGSMSMLSISEWRGAHMHDAGALYTRERHRENSREMLAKIIAFAGENHTSKVEVLEQYLLFLILISKASLESQGILQKVKIDVLMQRIIILQHKSPYFTALCEIFEENMHAIYHAV